jgi:hypothetical protein
MNDPEKIIKSPYQNQNCDHQPTFIQPETVARQLANNSSSPPVKTNSFASFLKWTLMVGGGGMGLIVILIFLGFWNLGSRFIAAIDGFLNAPPATPEVDIPTVVISQVQGVSELTTSVFVMEAVVPASQDQKIGSLTIGETKLLYIAHGEVKAGIDLDRLKPEQIKVENNKLEIQLPPPIILDSKIDVNRSYVYDYDRGFLGLGPDVGTDLQTFAQRETLAKITTSACEQGVLEEANKRAELVVSQLLTTAGYENVVVKTTPPATDACLVPQN